MRTDTHHIRAVLEGWAAAVRAKDMSGILANHTEDMVMFDVPEPLQSKGMQAYRETWDLFYRYSPGGDGSFDLSQIEISAGDSVAYATAIVTIFGSPLRLTVGLRKHGDNWLIAHEHHSYAAPLDTAPQR